MSDQTQIGSNQTTMAGKLSAIQCNRCPCQLVPDSISGIKEYQARLEIFSSQQVGSPFRIITSLMIPSLEEHLIYQTFYHKDHLPSLLYGCSTGLQKTYMLPKVLPVHIEARFFCDRNSGQVCQDCCGGLQLVSHSYNTTFYLD